MQIDINDQYRLTSDPLNVVVEQKRVATEKSRNPGSERWVAISYHNTVQQAVTWLLNHSVRISPDSDVQRMCDTLTQLGKDITSAIQR